MKRKIFTITLSLVLALVALFVVAGAVYADDPLEVDIVIIGDEPEVDIDIYGDNPNIYINGQDIQEPTVYSYSYTAFVENLYDDSELWVSIEDIYGRVIGQQVTLGDMEANLGLLSEGLSKAILALGSHNVSLSEIAGELKDLEARTNLSLSQLGRVDKELAKDIRDLEARLLAELALLEESQNNYMLWVIVGLSTAIIGLLIWASLITVKIKKR